VVFADLGMSLDGFIAGPNAGPDNALGDRGDRVHQWQYEAEAWRERQGQAGGQVNRDHEPREPWVRQGGTTFTFVTDGIASAVDQAREAAAGKDVHVAGGAATVQQALNAGLIDELQLHLAPVLLGSGVRLFDRADPDKLRLEITRVAESPAATHLWYRVTRSS
jgi:riboflavin biosynthesis pyrimidine reductase